VSFCACRSENFTLAAIGSGFPEKNVHRSRSACITKHQRLVYIRSLLDKVLEISTVQCVGIIRALNNARLMR